MADEPLGRMTIELGLDDSSFGKGLQGAKAEVKYAMADMKSSMAVVGQAGKQFDTLSAKSRGLTTVIQAQAKQVRALKSAYEGSLVDGKATTQTGKYATQLQNANAKLASLQTQYKNNAGAIAKARVETTGFTGALNKSATVMGNVGSKMTSIGRTATTNVTAPIALGFAAATKSAISFDSQIQSIGPLLTNGGKITTTVRKQLDQMGESSKKWAVQYGTSTTEINAGMGELVRRGYSAKAAIGAMPSILDASKASGEGLGTVMHATASILEQFGMNVDKNGHQLKSTAAMTKATAKVTDSLTYAANATAAGFGDMSEAMSYVGPQAHAAGMSVQETAAAIGILSNRGIEGQKAGTTLRGVLTTLVKPTRQNTAAFKEMGLSTARLKSDSNNLPQLIDDIQKGTKGWTKADKEHAVAQAFGRENSAAMFALLDAGSGSLKKLTKNTNDATGATKKVADQLNNTKANQLKRMKEEVETLGITIGNDLLPIMPKVLSTVDGAVKAFDKLSPATQKNVVKLGLFAAAAGPIVGTLGKITSGIAGPIKGFVTLDAKIASFVAKRNAAKTVFDGVKTAAGEASPIVDQFGNKLPKVTSAVSDVEGASKKAAAGIGSVETSMGSAAGSTAGLTATISPLGVALGVTAVAVGLGVAVWETWGKQAYASGQRAGEWGSDVGAATSSSLSSMLQFKTQTENGFVDLKKTGSGAAQQISKDFETAFSKMSKAVQSRESEEQKIIGKLPASLKTSAQKRLNDQKNTNNQTLTSDKNLTTQVVAMYSNAAAKHRNLTADEATFVNNAYTTMADDQIKLSGLSAKKQTDVQKALSGDLKGMNQAQLTDAISGLNKVASSEQKSYDKEKSALKDALSHKLISRKQYSQSMSVLNAKDSEMTNKLDWAHIQALKQSGASGDQINQVLKGMGTSYDSLKSKIAGYASAAAKSNSDLVKTTTDMSSKTKKAADNWNTLVFDPKTGKLKTNAQDEVNKAAQSKNTWNGMVLLAKQGRMSTNAKAMMITAGLASGQWNSMSLKQKEAVVHDKATASLVTALGKTGQWQQLTLKQQSAILKTSGDKLEPVLQKMGIWNSLPLSVKHAIAQDKATGPMNGAKGSVDRWNGTGANSKTAHGTDNASRPFGSAKGSVYAWNTTGVSQKTAQGHDSASGPFNGAKNSVHGWNGTSASTKIAIGKDNASNPINNAIGALSHWNGMKDVVHHITTVFDQITGKKKALGTQSWGGGPMTVNDQKGPTFRELVRFPNGSTWLPEGRDVTFNAPQSTQVYTAPITDRMFGGVPQFANGISMDSDLIKNTTNLTQRLNEQHITQNNFDSGNVVQSIKQLFDVTAMQTKSIEAIRRVVGHDSSGNDTTSVLKDILAAILGSQGSSDSYASLLDRMNHDRKMKAY